jgi:hypothetical protein
MAGNGDEVNLAVNDAVRVNVAGNGVLTQERAARGARTRIEEVLPGHGAAGRTRYVVTAPRRVNDLRPPTPGTACTLEWPGEGGLWMMPVSFVGTADFPHGGSGWLLDAVDSAWQDERRRYLRVRWSVPVAITLMSAAEVRDSVALGLAEPSMAASTKTGSLPHSMEGRTRDISEGGISCRLPGVGLQPGLAVSVHFSLLGDFFDVPSRVLRVQPVDEDGEKGLVIAVAFDRPARFGERLRPLLFAEHLRDQSPGLRV